MLAIRIYFRDLDYRIKRALYNYAVRLAKRLEKKRLDLEKDLET